ncbi:unnamed protein product [Caenorhabditis brenneri]
METIESKTHKKLTVNDSNFITRLLRFLIGIRRRSANRSTKMATGTDHKGFAPRGNYYAEKNAKRIDYVSFAHFIVTPKFDEYEMKMDNVRVVGTKLINQTLIQNLRKANPNIKIVPRFACSKFTPDIVKMFVQTEWLVQRSAQTIANYCREHGFDGVVFDCPTLLSKGILAEERFFEDINAVDLYRNMLETLEQVGNVIRANKLIAIFSMESPVHLISLESLESEAEIFLLPPQFSHSVMNAYDFVHIWTDGNSNRPMNHQYSHDRFLEKIMKFFNYSPKLLVGFTFFGHKIPLDEYRKGGNEKKWELIEYRSYLKVLKKDDAVLTFNEVNKEHELTSENANVFIIFPSLTQLEYRLAHIIQHPGVGIGIWEYGQGLPYFTNLV